MWRVAEGELPYRDFQQMYGPSVFFLGGWLFRIFDSDLAVLRYLLLAIKAATCVLVYLGARRISAPLFACIAYSLAVVLAGLPWPIVTTPYASFFGTLLCLAGLLSFLALERRFLLGCAVAGLFFGLASTFKQTSGAFAFLALCLYLLVDDGVWKRRPGRTFASLIRASRGFVLLVTAAVAVVYLVPRNPFWNLALLLTPILCLICLLALREIRRAPEVERQLRSFWGMVALSVCFLLPLVGYALFFFSLGLGDEFLFNTVSGIPSVVNWISPFPTPDSTFVLWQIAVLCSFGAVVFLRRHSGAPLQGSRLWMFLGLAGASVMGFGALAVKGWHAPADDWWFWGSSDLLLSLPWVLVWLSIAKIVRLGRASDPNESPSQRRSFILFTCYATMGILWLYPAADIWHVLALLPSCLPLLAHHLDRFWRTTGVEGRDLYVWRLRAGVLIGVFILVLAVPSVRDLLRERGGKPAFNQSLPRATGIVGDTAQYSSTRNGGKLVRYLNESERRNDPIFILSAKSLIYFLTNRISPVQKFEYVLYLVATSSIQQEKAREWIDETTLIRKLQEVRPLIIDDDFDERSENVRRMYPRVAQFILAHYQVDKVFGRFRVLRWIDAIRSGS